MPVFDGKEYPYTTKGIADLQAAKRKSFSWGGGQPPQTSEPYEMGTQPPSGTTSFFASSPSTVSAGPPKVALDPFVEGRGQTPIGSGLTTGGLGDADEKRPVGPRSKRQLALEKEKERKALLNKAKGADPKRETKPAPSFVEGRGQTPIGSGLTTGGLETGGLETGGDSFGKGKRVGSRGWAKKDARTTNKK
jgi:hypothetical protein